MSKRNWKKYLLEGILIVFSVMLALFLNKTVERIETNNQRDQAIANIRAELENNLSVVERWTRQHEFVAGRVNRLLEGKNDSLRKQMLNSSIFNIGVLTDNRSIIDANLSNTAWETAKTTQIINEFDFETVQLLTSTYSLQELIMDQTIPEILSLYFDRETHDPGKLDGTLVQFKLRFEELLGQERLITDVYRGAVAKLE